MTVNEWAQRWGIPTNALNELTQLLSVDCTSTETGYSEAAVSSRIVLAASKRGIRLFRNNVGACQAEDGRVIRYGLANESTRINSVIKSSDYIGITPRTINGQRVGVFTSIEVKRAGWHYTGIGREVAQKRWLDFVNASGGIGFFANDDRVVNEICIN